MENLSDILGLRKRCRWFLRKAVFERSSIFLALGTLLNLATKAVLNVLR